MAWKLTPQFYFASGFEKPLAILRIPCADEKKTTFKRMLFFSLSSFGYAKTCSLIFGQVFSAVIRGKYYRKPACNAKALI
ncbi:MAG: hypothetical protein CR988_05790 [Treponema sp.]|nr:MAG: hypothetical protein CR988_05790 [Treponema sp.]